MRVPVGPIPLERFTHRRDRRGRIWWSPRLPTPGEKLNLVFIAYADGVLANPIRRSPLLRMLREMGP